MVKPETLQPLNDMTMRTVISRGSTLQLSASRRSSVSLVRLMDDGQIINDQTLVDSEESEDDIVQRELVQSEMKDVAIPMGYHFIFEDYSANQCCTFSCP